MKVQIYKDPSGEMRWRAIERNGRIIANGGEGYVDAFGAKRGVDNVVTEFRSALNVVDEVDGDVLLEYPTTGYLESGRSTLEAQLLAVLSDHVGERGGSEGAVDALRRIIAERDRVLPGENITQADRKSFLSALAMLPDEAFMFLLAASRSGAIWGQPGGFREDAQKAITEVQFQATQAFDRMRADAEQNDPHHNGL